MNSSECKNRERREGREGILRREVHDQGAKRKLKFQDEREELYGEAGTEPLGTCLWAFVKIFI